MDNATLRQIEYHLSAASSSLHQAWALAVANGESAFNHYGELADLVKYAADDARDSLAG